jgi:peptidoglycan/LPS O-acetylase OafA/YrhL
VIWVYRDYPVNTVVWAMLQIPGSIDQFVLGSASAVALRWWRQEGRRWIVAPRRGAMSLLCAGSLAGIIGMMYFLDSVYAVYWKGHWAVYVWYSITASFVAVLILSIAVSGTLPRWMFENRTARFLGDISYSLYLWHFPVALVLAQTLDAPRLGLAKFTLLGLPIIIVVSSTSYYLAERPFLARRTH